MNILDAIRIVAECRAAGFIDDAGNVRKVLGTLPMTADGFIVGFPPGFGGVWRVPYEYGGGERVEQCDPRSMSYDQASRQIMVRGGAWSSTNEHPIGGCYSTKEAALNAAQPQKD